MDTKEVLRDSLKTFMQGLDCTEIISAQVKSLDEENEVCEVVDHDGIEYPEVRLSASTDTTGGFLIVPKIDSWVLIGNIGHSETEYFIVSVSSIDKVLMRSDQMSMELNETSCLIKKQSTEFEIQGDGIKISSGGESLKGLIGELINAVKLITVPGSAPGVPTGTPLNFPEFDALKARFNSLLK